MISGQVSLRLYSGVVFLTAFIACGVAVLAGIYPAYYVTSFPPALVLKGNFGLSPRGRIVRNVLIGFQYVASFALIIGSSFMFLQNNYMRNSSLGYEKDALIVVKLNSTVQDQLNAFTNELKAFSGIENITYAENVLSTSSRMNGFTRPYKDKAISFQRMFVDPSFLQVMNIPIIEGRDFRPEDKNTSSGAFIFNEKAKYDFELEIGEKVGDVEVIGIMPDFNFASLHSQVEPMGLFVSGNIGWPLDIEYAYVQVKKETDLKGAFQHVQNTLLRFDDTYPFEVFFFDEVLQTAYDKERKMTWMITLFSLLAIFISIVGVFGLVIFESQYRIKEIGLRKVMGSTTKEIIFMFNAIYIRILVICFILAAPIGYLVVKNWLQNFAYQTPMYWWVFVIAFLVVGTVTACTVTFQNWRTANANPIESIKTE